VAVAIGPDPSAAVTAFNRFGLGAKPGDLALAASDPRGFLLEELWTQGAALIGDTDLPPTPRALQQFFLDQQQRRIERERAAMTPAPVTQPLGPNATGGVAIAPEQKPKPQEPNIAQKLFRNEAMARFAKGAKARSGFVERLVAFWSNHFAVSAAKGGFVRVTAGPFEREAIRPHVCGKFADLLKAVETHPAMIFYLDNQRSIGPNANAGRLGGRGLNENLAREILELHTLGVDAGYTQADVTELARILTGWSFAEAESGNGEPGSFLFKANWHEPGPHNLLGKVYPQQGKAQGEEALDDLARHPATAKHLATKLARHFVADDPPPALVDALSRKFRDSDGDLAVVASALVADDRAWHAPATKMRTPVEFIMAAVRATGFLPQQPGPILHGLNMLGMPLWQPGGPNGFADTAATWASPEAMKLRLDLSARMAQLLRQEDHPLAILDTVCGPTASRETRAAVERAESRQQALAILFMSPEFQRR
jgi:uncharacterized protein (DUF1800 family)